MALETPEIPTSPNVDSQAMAKARDSQAKSPSRVVSSIREQAVEKYTALTRHKRELVRKNQKIQTKIAQHLRKNKIELTSNTTLVLSDEDEKAEYNRLLQELADLMVTTEREAGEFDQDIQEIQVKLSGLLQFKDIRYFVDKKAQS